MPGLFRALECVAHAVGCPQGLLLRRIQKLFDVDLLGPVDRPWRTADHRQILDLLAVAMLAETESEALRIVQRLRQVKLIAGKVPLQQTLTAHELFAKAVDGIGGLNAMAVEFSRSPAGLGVTFHCAVQCNYDVLSVRMTFHESKPPCDFVTSSVALSAEDFEDFRLLWHTMERCETSMAEREDQQFREIL